MARYRYIDGKMAEVVAGPRQPSRAPHIMSDYLYRYDCPVTGEAVDGKAEHRANLSKHGCRVLEKGETREGPRRRAEEQDARIDKILADVGAE